MRSKKKSASQILKKRALTQKRKYITTTIRWFNWSAVVLSVLGVLGSAGIYLYLSKDLPKISSLKDYHPPIITTVYSDDNRKIAEFYNERRIVIPMSEIPKTLIDAFVAAEDARFYKHEGIDFLSIIRAFFKNIEAGAIVQGGSTITQQVTKSFLLTPEKSYTRKIKEAILAHRIDRTFSKDEILLLYLNQIYLGHGAYGVEAAAENYFRKSVRELNLTECAILAGLPQAPSKYSPFKFPEKAKERQIYVLNRMVAEGYIDNIQATEAINVKLDIKPRRNWYIEEIPFYTEQVRRYVEKKYGPAMLYNEGLKIYTAANIEMQQIARTEIKKGLKELDKRQGYRGPLNHFSPEAIETFSKKLQIEFDKTPLEKGKTVKGVVIDVNDRKNEITIRMGNAKGIIGIANMKWAREPNPEVASYESFIKHVGDILRIGDVILVKLKGKKKDSDLWTRALEQGPEGQGALLAIEAETGRVKVMIGGRDFRES
ncbi:MAG TPA: transglycosylase domain-containing protein, partial [Desulfobacterales bacterium]|nr:transglycosylase domain-containing protein [Desulfobacterales bacterium]